MRKTKLMVACSQKLEGVPEIIPLLPLGQVTSTKGDFKVDEESYQLMRKAMSDHGVDIVIDYEHQTLTGGKAPAAGWIKELILSDGIISARVDWTEEAAGYLRNKEYRYSSPVVLARRTDNKAVKLLSLALTNTPAIDGMYPIINSDIFDDESEEETMELLKKLAALLGLPETATEDEVLAAVTAQCNNVTALKAQCAEKDKVVVNSMLAPLLEVEANADLSTVSAKLLALKAHTGYVPQADYDAVKTKLDELERNDMVELALKEGKITPTQKEWAVQYALKDKDGFAKFVECMTPQVPMQQNKYPATAPGTKAPADETMVVCKALGVSDEDLKTYGGK